MSTTSRQRVALRTLLLVLMETTLIGVAVLEASSLRLGRDAAIDAVFSGHGLLRFALVLVEAAPLQNRPHPQLRGGAFGDFPGLHFPHRRWSTQLLG